MKSFLLVSNRIPFFCNRAVEHGDERSQSSNIKWSCYDDDSGEWDNNSTVNSSADDDFGDDGDGDDDYDN